MPVYCAVPLALLASAIGATTLAVLGVFTLGFLVGADGPGAGVLIICAIPNIAVPAFVVSFSVLVNLHHPTSWRTPTFAFAAAAILLWVWGHFGVRDIPFAAFVLLGTGAIACLACCWFLRRKLSNPFDHVLEA
jgi:hypothetical protein